MHKDSHKDLHNEGFSTTAVIDIYKGIVKKHDKVNVRINDKEAANILFNKSMYAVNNVDVVNNQQKDWGGKSESCNNDLLNGNILCDILCDSEKLMGDEKESTNKEIKTETIDKEGIDPNNQNNSNNRIGGDSISDQEENNDNISSNNVSYENFYEYSLSHLNVNGWNHRNKTMRENLLLYTKSDFISVNETHLKANENICLKGYQWIGQNRKEQHVKAVRAFGGVGLFYKDYISKEYDIKVLDADKDGILTVLFAHKETKYNFAIHTCYLPPEHSRHGRDAIGFFMHLTSEMYRQHDIDLNIIVGDFNARIGNLKDYIEEIDNIQPRIIQDKVINQHGTSFVEFLLESNCCILNGRFGKESANFTSISTKGTAVVDYIAVSNSEIHKFSEFTIKTCGEILEELDLGNLFNTNCRMPDHSVITCKFATTAIRELQNEIEKPPENNEKRTRYAVDKIQGDFLNNINIREKILQLNEEILLCNETQENINTVFKNICELVIKEMNEKIIMPEKKENTKRLRPMRPFWTDELDRLFRTVVGKERAMKKCKYRTRRRILKQEYKIARNNFDKSYRRVHRQYEQGETLKFETYCITEPNKFWESIKKLGPKKKQSIPMQIYNDTGEIICDQESVLNKWKSEFEQLYNNQNINEHEVSLEYRIAKRMLDDSVYLKEQIMLDPLYETDEVLNANFTNKEIEIAISKAKLKKAVGIDLIPNEALKNNTMIEILKPFFQLCFDTGKVPNQWTQAIIKPIPKSTENDPKIPLNYRGISLLSCISKIYTSILNKRIIEKLESNSVIVEEQNGFRKGRSCQEHVFVLQTAIKSRQKQAKHTIVSFIDFSKAFDVVDREKLFYKLLQVGIEGKMYNTIKSLYKNTEAQVLLNNVKTAPFKTMAGVRQGDCMSPTLFSIFINDLAQRIKNLNQGINIGTTNLSILLYADDIAIIADNENDMQHMLNEVNDWCKEWSMNVNISKTKVVDFRKIKEDNISFQFMLGDKKIRKWSIL